MVDYFRESRVLQTITLGKIRAPKLITMALTQEVRSACSQETYELSAMMMMENLASMLFKKKPLIVKD